MRGSPGGPALGGHGGPLCQQVRFPGIKIFVLASQTSFSSNIVSALGGGLWSVVVGDWDRGTDEGSEVIKSFEEMINSPTLQHNYHD